MSMQDPTSSADTGSNTWSGSMGDNSDSQSYGAYDPADKARQKAGEVMDQAQDKVGEVADKVKEQATSQISSQKDRAAEGLGSVADAIRQTGDQLRKNEQAAPVAQYADQLAQGVEMASNYLKSRSISDIFNEVERFARREPALFLGGALTLGLLGGRFLRSSSKPETPSHTGGQYRQSDMYGYGYGSYSNRRTGYPSSSDNAGYNSYNLPGSMGSEYGSQGYTGAGSSSYYTAAASGLDDSDLTSGSTGSTRNARTTGSSSSTGRSGTTGSSSSTGSSGYSSSYPTDSYGSSGSTGQSYGSSSSSASGGSAESGGPQGVV